jgi:peptidoglycan hydrolase-like protein with peptidoglycan-binding domain
MLAAVGAGVWLAFGGDSGTATAASTEQAATTLALVERRDLADTETFSGTLGYAGAGALVAATQGTITRLAPEGSTRVRGQVLYRIDDRPVVLMYGTVPAWRALSDGVDDGPDVRELEWNLVALGHDPNRDVVIDDHFNWATAAAVNRWQEALGETETGRVDLGAVAFLPGPRRIGEHSASVGASVQPGTEVLSTSATRQEVVLDLDATRQTLVAVGRRVAVGFPDGSTVPGRISAVGKVATVPTQSSEASADPSTDTTPTIEVTIELLRRPEEELDQAPVDVELTTEGRQNVLAIPVTALVAVLGGGYAVEVQTEETTRLVAVTPGLYADGYVEIVRGVREGDHVVVPQ